MYRALTLLFKYNEYCIFATGFLKLLNKFRVNMSSGNRVVARRKKDGRMDGQTDMVNVTVAFRKFTNALKKNNMVQKLVTLNFPQHNSIF